MSRNSAQLFILLLSLVPFTMSCKSSGSDGFDLLTGVGSSVDQLTIEQVLPDVESLSLEINQNQTFTVTARAPAPREASFVWLLNGTPVSSTSNYIFQATASNVGTYELKLDVSDGVDTRTRIWSIKVNGPPVITPVTTGTPKVSVGSSINFNATATDPNGDNLTYAWTINGASSEYLTGTTGTGTLTGHSSLVGDISVTLTVSDGTASTSYTWTAEVNYFPQACNELQQNQICTYGGSPHKGNGLAVNNTQYPLRFRPISHTFDAQGNMFISDLDNNVVWFWNRSAASVTRVGVTVAPDAIQVVAGTGDATSGAAGVPALQSELNGPRGLWYNDATDTLYIAEYSGSRVKYVNSAGIVFIGFGASNNNTDGTLAYNHQCSNPATLAYYSGSLYITCYGNHRVKSWDLSTDLGYIVAGTGSNNVTGNNVAPTAGGIGAPYGLYVDATGIYVGSFNQDVIRYINTTGGARTFWSGNPDQITVSNGMMSTIAGSGGTGATSALADPLHLAISNPSGITVRNGNEIYVAVQGQHAVALFNDSASNITISGQTISSKQSGKINFGTAGYNGSNIALASARMNSPYALVIDPLDNNKLVIADYNNARIREANLSSETLINLAGSGLSKNGFYGDGTLPTMSHLFNYPSGIAIDNANNDVFFVDMNNYRMRRITKYGEIATVAGRGAGDPTIDNDFAPNILMRTNLTGPNVLNGIDVLADGSILQINTSGHNFRFWNRSGGDNNFYGIFVQDDRINSIGGDWVAGSGTGGSGLSGLNTQLSYPTSVRAYGTSLFVVDSNNHCIRELDNTGTMTSVLGTCGTNGDQVSQNLAAGSALMDQPKDIAFDENGNMYITDYNNHKIRLWNRSASPVTVGAITVPAGNFATIGCFSGGTGSTSEGILASTSRCNTPTGIAYTSGKVCYAQRGRHNVRCINLTTGIVNTVAGYPEASPRAGTTIDFSQEGVSGTSATLYYPSGVAFDVSGDLYITDTYNHVIKKLKLSP